MNNIKQALESAEKLISKAIIFESEAQEYLSESNYELNGCLGDCAATIAVNGKQVLADVKAALEHLQTNALDKCEAVYLILSGVHEIAVSKAKYDEWTSVKRISYISPPQQQWVGLSDDEIDKMWEFYRGGWYDFAMAIEAKLKELNTCLD